MKAEEIKAGDVLLDTTDGSRVYTVELVTVNWPHVVAVVRYADGGTGRRMWEIGKDVPLARPL